MTLQGKLDLLVENKALKEKQKEEHSHVKVHKTPMVLY
jgi:hypothetical protein